MIFDLGHAWHDTVQRYGKSGAWGEPAGYRAEVPIDPDAKAFDGNPILPLAHRYWIRGHADAVLDRYIVPKVPGLGDVSIKVVHEYKTINSGQYSKLTRPKPEHKWQATMYSAVFDAPIAVYLYVNKDNCQLIDFPVAFDNSIWNAIVQKIDRVQHYTNSEQMPPWEETSAVQNKSECESCGYRKLCAPTAAQLVQIGGK
jgi:CRISPR/Cas system-associated exonuclease Cas4 (RecB family)